LPIRVFSAAVALGLGLTLAASGASATPGTATIPAATAASVATDVSVIAPLTVPTGSGGLIDAETLAEYTDPLGLLTRQLDAVAGKPVVVAIDPMILASIRVLGTSAPESARSWLERLSLISNETVPLPYANSDPTLATQSGELGPLAPISFNFALDEANFAAVADPEPTTTPEPTDVGTSEFPTYPSTEQLLAWDYSIDGFLQPRANSVVSSDLGAWAESGFSTVTMSSTNVTQDSAAGSVAAIEGVTALISDAASSAAMDEALGSTLDRDVTAAGTALSSAVIAAGAAQSAPTASVLIVIDHSLELSAARLDTALASLTASPSISLVPLTTLAATKPTTATVNDMPQSAERLADFARLTTAAQQERSYFSIADDPGALIAQRRLALLDVLGAIATDESDGWGTAVNGFLVDSNDYRTAVTVVESSNFLFLANNSFLPVSVNNNLNQAVTVFITVDPRTALLAVDEERVKVHIEANSQAKGDVPVQALSNGLVNVEISLTSSTGQAIGTSTLSEINVQAGWETPIVLAFAALIVVIFAAGFIRSIVRRRKPADD